MAQNVFKLEIQEKTMDGKLRERTVRFKLSPFGRARLLEEGALPGGMERRYKGTLLEAFVSNSSYQIVKTRQGWRLADELGRIYQYEFSIELADGSKGIPYKESFFGKERLFLDMRNTALSKMLDGAKIRVWVNDVALDLENSFKGEITRVYKAVKLYSLDGKGSCLYVQDEEDRIPAKLPPEPSPLPIFHEFFLIGKRRQDSLGKAGAGISAEYEIKSAAIGSFPQGSRSGLLYEEQPFSDLAGQDFGAQEPALPHRLPYFDISEPLPEPAFASWKSQKPASAKHKADQNGKGSRKRQAQHQLVQGNQLKPVPLNSISKLKAAIFDLDGVVVDSEQAHLRTFNKALLKFGVKISKDFWRRNYTGVGSVAILKDVFRRHGISEDISDVLKKRAEIYHDYIEKKGLKEVPGFMQFFRYLQKNGISAAIASGGHKPHILASMMSLGLPKIPFVGLEDVKNRKPSPEAFLLAAEKLGVSPSECIVFEDSLAGFQAAASAGMPCIALATTLPRKEIQGKAALVVKNFRSSLLKKAISRLIVAGKRQPSRKRG
ncbi:MAG: HAD family phosphatase [Candidatus Micrarchaeota archaeon]|nr:HAD family phosphatase [Candidatus Micrarchaeota archaeon]